MKREEGVELQREATGEVGGSCLLMVRVSGARRGLARLCFVYLVRSLVIFSFSSPNRFFGHNKLSYFRFFLFRLVSSEAVSYYSCSSKWMDIVVSKADVCLVVVTPGDSLW